MGINLFTFNNCEYLVMVDYYSNYFEVDNLETYYAMRKVIENLKGQFACHLIPKVVVTNNGHTLTVWSSMHFQYIAILTIKG